MNEDLKNYTDKQKLRNALDKLCLEYQKKHKLSDMEIRSVLLDVTNLY